MRVVLYGPLFGECEEGFVGRSLVVDSYSRFLYQDSTTIASQREIPDLDMCLRPKAVVASDSTVAPTQVILRAASD